VEPAERVVLEVLGVSGNRVMDVAARRRTLRVRQCSVGCLMA